MSSGGFTLHAGDKFSCIALENIATDDSLNTPVDLNDGFWALPKPPFGLDDTWREWIGSIRSKSIDRCNLFLVATLPSKTPDILDGENQQLTNRLNGLFYGLLFQGIPDHIKGYTLTGARRGEEVGIRSMSELREHFHSHPTERVEISAATCHVAKRFMLGNEALVDSKDFARLKRGIRAVVRGIREGHVEDRIHEYVRALEALVKPEIGASTRQFVHRCMTFAGVNDATKQILEDGYAIRSAVEHMHGMEAALGDYPEEQHKAIGLTRLRQIETLARGVYLRAVTSPAQRAIFKTDADIDVFWGLRDDERRRTWGEPIVIASTSWSRLVPTWSQRQII